MCTRICKCTYVHVCIHRQFFSLRNINTTHQLSQISDLLPPQALQVHPQKNPISPQKSPIFPRTCVSAKEPYVSILPNASILLFCRRITNSQKLSRFYTHTRADMNCVPQQETWAFTRSARVCIESRETWAFTWSSKGSCFLLWYAIHGIVTHKHCDTHTHTRTCHRANRCSIQNEKSGRAYSARIAGVCVFRHTPL